MPEELDILRLEFLNFLSKAGIGVETSQIDGTIPLTPEQVINYLRDGRDVFLANRAGVPVEDWRRWRDFIFAGGSHIPLLVFLANPPRVRVERPAIPKELRWEVWERDNFTCKICGARKHLSVDHIIPVSKGGQTIKGNLQTLCRNCNSQKGVTYAKTS